MPEFARTWQIREARANFSALVDKAVSEGPQIVTRNGKKMVVVISAEEWQRQSNREGDLVDFFAKSPLHEEGMEIERIVDYPGEVDL